MRNNRVLLLALVILGKIEEIACVSCFTSGIQPSRGKYTIDQVNCVKTATHNLCNSLGTLLPQNLIPTNTLTTSINSINQNGNKYTSSSNLKSWVKTLMSAYATAYSNHLKNVAYIDVNQYFTRYANNFNTALSACRLTSSDFSSLKRYFQSTQETVLKKIEDNRRASEKKKEQARRQAEKEKKKTKTSVQQRIEEHVNSRQAHRVSGDTEMTFVQMPSYMANEMNKPPAPSTANRRSLGFRGKSHS